MRLPYSDDGDGYTVPRYYTNFRSDSFPDFSLQIESNPFTPDVSEIVLACDLFTDEELKRIVVIDGHGNSLRLAL